MNLIGNSELALEFLAACAIKSTIVLALAWMTAAALRREPAALRHRVWAAAILGTLVLPALTVVLPAWHSPALGNAAALWTFAPASGPASAAPRLSSMAVRAAPSSGLRPGDIVLAVWVLGFLVVVTRLLAGLAHLAWISTRARPVFEGSWLRMVAGVSKSLGITRPVRLLESRNPTAMPLTWGFFRPRILLPAGAMDWPEERRRMVVSHELAHIARRDWPLQICAELARGFYWFHPFAWVAAAGLRRESERASDDSVLNSGVRAPDYADELLHLARTLENPDRAWSAALAMARPSNLERRFVAMLNPSINRRRLSRRAKLLTAFATMCVLIPLAALRAPGQDLSGRFTGTVFEPSNAVVPNATIIMTNSAAHTKDMTTSDAAGNFVFNGLPAGTYEMTVLSGGFATYTAPQLVLEAGRDASHFVTLKIGRVQETVTVQAQGTPRAPEVPAPGVTPARIRVGGNVQAAQIQKKVTPLYPPAAKASGIQGAVLLEAIIAKDGSLLSLRVINSQIDPDLARSAVEAVSQWHYRPTLLNGVPVEVITQITVNFTLSQ